MDAVDPVQRPIGQGEAPGQLQHADREHRQDAVRARANCPARHSAWPGANRGSPPASPSGAPPHRRSTPAARASGSRQRHPGSRAARCGSPAWKICSRRGSEHSKLAGLLPGMQVLPHREVLEERRCPARNAPGYTRSGSRWRRTGRSDRPGRGRCSASRPACGRNGGPRGSALRYRKGRIRFPARPAGSNCTKPGDDPPHVDLDPDRASVRHIHPDRQLAAPAVGPCAEPPGPGPPGPWANRRVGSSRLGMVSTWTRGRLPHLAGELPDRTRVERAVGMSGRLRAVCAAHHRVDDLSLAPGAVVEACGRSSHGESAGHRRSPSARLRRRSRARRRTRDPRLRPGVPSRLHH